MNTQQKLIEIFRDFPTVGARTASRFVYYLVKLPKERIDEIINVITELKNKIKLCPMCFQPFEASGDLCLTCADTRRNKNLLCIVEKETDLLSLENTGKYNGLYFILGGTVSTMKKEDIDQLRIEELKKRFAQNNFSEIIIALNPTPEGRTTSVIVEQIIKEACPSTGSGQMLKVSHLARGIPVGGELEYADEETLENALENRK